MILKSLFFLTVFCHSAYSLTSSEINQAVNNGLYFSIIPDLKNRIVDQRLTKTDLKTLQTIVNDYGGEQFELLSTRYLKAVSSGPTKYLAAKQLFKDGKFRSSLKLVEDSLGYKDNLRPYKLLLAGSASLMTRDEDKAEGYFKRCMEQVRKNKGSSDSQQIFNKELGYTYDSCLVGLARIHFQKKNFKKAKDLYGLLDKSSLIWPEILFEEAWNSFYENDFNRTLGKLITYNSPFIYHVFNPEVEILNALTYLELCRYEDAKSIVNNFYKTYKKDLKVLKSFNRRYAKSPTKLGKVSRKFASESLVSNKLLSKLFNSINRDLAFQRLSMNFQKIKDEINLVKKIQNRKLRRKLGQNLKTVFLNQLKLMGNYSYRILKRQEKVLQKSMVGMSYINLEIIKKLKRDFFNEPSEGAKIGNIKNLKRDSGQYLWDFNGEFWADELGDYVFSLKSSCG